MKVKKSKQKLSLNKKTIARLELNGDQMNAAYAGLDEGSLYNCFTEILGISCVYYTCNQPKCPQSLTC